MSENRKQILEMLAKAASPPTRPSACSRRWRRKPGPRKPQPRRRPKYLRVQIDADDAKRAGDECAPRSTSACRCNCCAPA